VDSTDSKGVAEFRGVPEHDVIIHLQHSALGRQFGTVRDGAQEEVEVVFESDSTINLRTADGVESLEGVLCHLLDSIGRSAMTSTSDTGGHALFEMLGPGRYNIRAERRDCWPADRWVEVNDGGTQVDLQMRRLGGFEIEVVSREGLAIRGQAVGLRSLEFDGDVAGWLAEQLVRSEKGLVTDATGHVRIEGLPHGPYRWTIALDGGGTLEGEVEVPVGSVGKKHIALP